MWQSIEDWIADARDADLEATAARFGANLKRAGKEMVGPCPACGGTDRFSINPQKRVWNCGHHGASGGDVIALVGHCLGLNPARPRDFMLICEDINGSPPPNRERQETAQERAEREGHIARRALEAQAKQREREEDAARFRDREIKRAWEIWQDSVPLVGSAAAEYLARRGITHQRGLRLRCHPALGYFAYDKDKKAFEKIGEYPAMIGACVRDEIFCGVHITYLDLNADDGKFKARPLHPKTGAVEPSKKIRGSVGGAVIRLCGPAQPPSLIIGEGIETVLSPRESLIERGDDLGASAFWSGISLGNMGGKAAHRVPHPDGIKQNGRVIGLPGPVPDLAEAAIHLPDEVVSVTILGDGDSEPVSTEFATRRAAARWVYPGRSIRRAWAADGSDFNQMLAAQ